MWHFKISSGLLCEYKRLIGWICSLIIITPTWITSPRIMRRVPHVTKNLHFDLPLRVLCYSYLHRFSTYIPPLGVDKTPKVIFWWTSIYFHHKPHSSSTFNGYDQYEDIGEFVQQWSTCWAKNMILCVSFI